MDRRSFVSKAGLGIAATAVTGQAVAQAPAAEGRGADERGRERRTEIGRADRRNSYHEREVDYFVQR